MAHNPFTRHPKEVGENYFQHFGHAAWFGVRMIGGGIACLVPRPSVPVRQDGQRTMDKLHSKLHGRPTRRMGTPPII